MSTQITDLSFQNPRGYEIPFSLLKDFERGLDPYHPEASQIPCRVLGYGEVSTAFEIDVEGLREFAFKRMSCFEDPDELEPYLDAYLTYNQLMENEVGLHLPDHGYAAFINAHHHPIFYIIQKRLDPALICSNALAYLTPPQIIYLMSRVLQELDKVWTFNRRGEEFQVSIDGQISNWALEVFDPQYPNVVQGNKLIYFDTSTPLYRKNGVEQVDLELFLRSAPPYLVWILRLLFLQDVATRYYDPRKVIIDLIANFYKEQHPELIPELVAAANEYLRGQGANLFLAEITEKEVKDYYREDVVIWRLYLGMRRFDRFIRKQLLHLDYPYILPGKIQR